MLSHVAATAPIRRNVTIDDVGNAAAFLCSDLAAGITGEVLYVDGGFHTVGMSFPAGERWRVNLSTVNSWDLTFWIGCRPLRGYRMLSPKLIDVVIAGHGGLGLCALRAPSRSEPIRPTTSRRRLPYLRLRQ